MKTAFTFLTCLVLSFLSYSQSFDVETIWQSGSIDDRINYVILGDGYQSSELTQFINDATNITNSLFNETPYKEYKNFFNVFAIKVPSNESGASHPGTATDVTEPTHPIATVDNYFGSTFDYFNIHRLLVPTNSLAINTVLANNFPLYDQVVIIANSPYYGGSGGAYATTSTESSSDEIAIHELGHSFVNLADEYYAGDVYARELINMTQETNPNSVKWTNWMNDNGIGIYQHCCGGNSANWYRPHESCKMRILGNPFCAVCTEGTIEHIHGLVDFIDLFSPENSQNIDVTSAQTFSINTIDPVPNTLELEWRLNGTVINNQDNSVSILPEDLLDGNNTLLVSVTDNSPYLKVDSHETLHFSSVTWNINANTLSIDEITSEKFKIELFPNPTQEVINLSQNLNEDFVISIIDFSGKQVMEKQINHSETQSQISLKSLPSGVYIVNFNFKNGITLSRKIVKE